MLRLSAIAVEVLGIAVVSAGIGVETVTGADIGLIIITAGSAVIAAGSLFYAKVGSMRR